MSYHIVLLKKEHNRKDFDCGVESLNTYLKTRSSQDHKKHIAVTYIMHDVQANNTAGYYTLSSTGMELKSLPDDMKNKLPKYPVLPATLIGRLAIDVNYHGQGLGTLLLSDAIKRAYQASQTIASHAVVVDAINDAAERFYQKYGFINLSSSNRSLFLPMGTIAKQVHN